MKPEALDLFAGAQGTGVGLARAGFRVTSWDLEPHPKHPEIAEFHVGDALEVLRDRPYLSRFVLVVAGPPCQGYSWMAQPGNTHPRLIAPVRDLLREWGGRYLIENIPDALWAMDHPVMVCGQALGLGVRRHRLFESNVFLTGSHRIRSGCWGKGSPIGVYGDHPEDSPNLRPNGTSRGQRARTLAEGQAAMGIDWMDWDDLTEAIPPAYTQFLGEQILDQLAAALIEETQS